MNVNKLMTIVAALGVLAVAGGKVYTGQQPNLDEVVLALMTVAAAVGFQRK